MILEIPNSSLQLTLAPTWLTFFLFSAFYFFCFFFFSCISLIEKQSIKSNHIYFLSYFLFHFLFSGASFLLTKNQCFKSQTGPAGWTRKTGNRWWDWSGRRLTRQGINSEYSGGDPTGWTMNQKPDPGPVIIWTEIKHEWWTYIHVLSVSSPSLARCGTQTFLSFC